MGSVEPLERAGNGAAVLDRHAARHAPDALDVSKASVGDLIDTKPPPRRWIAGGAPDSQGPSIPLGIVGIQASAGGTGKSMLMRQLAVSTCAKVPFLGSPISRDGAVMILDGEDDREESHRRLHPVLQHARSIDAARADEIDELVRERLFIFDRVGEDNRLTFKVDREAARTVLVERIIATAHQLPNVVLIILDPLSRFDGGDPNDNADGTRLIECAEHIRKQTGATVMIPHHVSKAGIRDPESGQEAVRGASGIVDGARWVGLLATMRRDDAKRYGVDPDDAGHYVRFTTPKANYSAPWPGLWLKRAAGGVLVPTDELTEVQTDSVRQRGQDRYNEVLPKLVELIRQKQIAGTPLTRRQVRDLAGTSGVFSVGDHALRSIVERALEERSIKEHKPEKGPAELHSW